MVSSAKYTNFHANHANYGFFTPFTPNLPIFLYILYICFLFFFYKEKGKNRSEMEEETIIGVKLERNWRELAEETKKMDKKTKNSDNM